MEKRNDCFNDAADLNVSKFSSKRATRNKNYQNNTCDDWPETPRKSAASRNQRNRQNGKLSSDFHNKITKKVVCPLNEKKID